MSSRFELLANSYQTRGIVGVVGISFLAIGVLGYIYFLGHNIIVYTFGFSASLFLFCWARANLRKARHFKKLDVVRLQESTDNDVTVLEELYKAYQQSIEERLPLLELALKNNDQKNAVLYSHDFKGSSAAVGLEEVRKSALQLESLSRNGDFKNAQKYFPRFVQELHEGSELLRQYLELQKKAQ